MKTDEIQLLCEHNRWANRRVLDAASRLTAEQLCRDLSGSYGSVRDTLTHILWAEWLWLERWKGTSPIVVFEPKGLPSVGDLKRRWSEVDREQAEFIGSLKPDELDRVIEYTNLQGEKWRYPLWQMIQHLIQHSAYHRGQVITRLRQLGAALASTDLLLFIDEKAGRA